MKKLHDEVVELEDDPTADDDVREARPLKKIRSLRCVRCCSASAAASILVVLVMWATGGLTSLVYFGATFYVDVNMWKQTLNTPDESTADPLANFKWDEDNSTTVDLHTHLREHQPNYRQNQPFPHTVIEGMVPLAFLQKVVAELPEGIDERGCAVGATNCYLDPLQKRKTEIASEDHMKPYTRKVFAAMRSRPFIEFLEKLTGIDELHPDPGYEGSGVHLTGTGGFLKVHADFNHLSLSPKWHRRVNTFIYLNEDWPDEFGGHLELWNRDLTSCVQRIKPDFGRFVAFSTTDFSYHGHPSPMKIPTNRSRRSIAMYYYTRGDRNTSECLNNVCTSMHTTIFKEPNGCQECQSPACARYNNSGFN